MAIDVRNMEFALYALARHLSGNDGLRMEIVVCGGSALQLMGFVTRTTRDVDVLALAETDATGRVNLSPADELPLALLEAVGLVARDLGLSTDWLNAGPGDLLNHGLPEGFVSRLEPRRFGECLVVHLVGRLDHICFKLYALINSGDLRHLADMQAMNPSNDEIVFAAKWCLTQDASELFPALVQSCLEKIGYPDAARSV